MPVLQDSVYEWRGGGALVTSNTYPSFPSISSPSLHDNSPSSSWPFMLGPLPTVISASLVSVPNPHLCALSLKFSTSCIECALVMLVNPFEFSL